MVKVRIYRNLLIILAMDILIFGLSFYLAHLLRFDFHISGERLNLFYKTLPLIIGVKIICFYFCDLYRGMWRFTSINDMKNIVRASIISFSIILFSILFYNRFEGFARTVFVTDLLFTILFIAGLRMIVRLYFESNSSHYGQDQCIEDFEDTIKPKRTLIIGAGNTGEKIFRLLRDTSTHNAKIVGFLDDQPVKIGKKIHGVKVLGTISDVKRIARKMGVTELVIAVPSATSQQMRKIVTTCKESGVEFKTVPGMSELLNGISMASIRKVEYRDLIGRDDVKLDESMIGQFIEGKVILVTGAAGSIGSEVCRQICRFKPRRILLFERAESPLYDIDLELRNIFENVDVVPILADTQNIQQLERAFSVYKPEIVFHAAAYKHVPMLEHHSWKAVRNNILATNNLAECATKYNVDRFVFVSTDKAVRPTNVMGATKRIAEILIQNQKVYKNCSTKFMIVRFGNVVGSAGSVLPLFKKQIAQGGPVTVTHPEVTRYFMTIPEASQLILQAGSMGEGGEIFILDMGTPIKIDSIARDLIRLSGFEPDDDIKIDYVGLRPGEKLYEELITEGEGIIKTSHKKIMVLRGSEQNLQELNGNIDQLKILANNQDGPEIIEKLKKIVPEYSPVVH